MSDLVGTQLLVFSRSGSHHNIPSFFSAQCGVSVIMQLVSFTAVYSKTASSGYITSVETFVYAQVNVVIAATIVSADEPR